MTDSFVGDTTGLDIQNGDAEDGPQAAEVKNFEALVIFSGYAP